MIRRLLAWARCQLRASHDLETRDGVTTCRRPGCPFRYVRPEPTRSDLTPREAQVALRIVGGMTNKEIAAALEMSVWTVRYHRQIVYAKCGVQGNGPTAALELAKVLGYLTTPDLGDEAVS